MKLKTQDVVFGLLAGAALVGLAIIASKQQTKIQKRKQETVDVDAVVIESKPLKK